MTLTKSKGATLAVSLVMLTAVTFVAVLGLQRSTLQTRMVANAQHSGHAFTIASSELEANYTWIKNEGDQLNPGIEKLYLAMNSVLRVNGEAVRNPDTGEHTFIPVVLDPASQYGGSDAEIFTDLLYTSGKAITINRTFAGDSSQSQFNEYRFRLKSTAKLTDNFKSSQELGVNLITQKGQ